MGLKTQNEGVKRKREKGFRERVAQGSNIYSAKRQQQ